MRIIRLLVDGAWYYSVGYRVNDACGFDRAIAVARLIASHLRFYVPRGRS